MTLCCFPVYPGGKRMLCSLPAVKTFADSGKGYCQEHYYVVVQNRAWLILKMQKKLWEPQGA